ncbi:MAG: RagB/SusD family nutrient uptake outer membrane protein [Marinifilaceae bacterium]
MRNVLYNVILVLVLAGGCNYLDMVPENDIETIETIFEKKEDAEVWMKTCYAFLGGNIASVHTNPAVTGADEFLGSQFIKKSTGVQFPGFKIADGLQMSQDPYGNVWRKDKFYAAIRYCNIFLEKVGNINNMTEVKRNQWTGEIKVLKAFFYFELVRRYGPIILVHKNFDVKDPIVDMQQPRSHIDSCFNAMVQLIDESIPHILPHDQKDPIHRGFFSLETAHALKAKILVYAASPLFNGNEYYTNFRNKLGEPLFNAEYDHERWKRAALAAEEAVRECEKLGRRLYKKTGSYSTALLNTMMDLENSVVAENFYNEEALMLIKDGGDITMDAHYYFTLPMFLSTDPHYNYKMTGCISPSLKMVEMFYTENGVPIDMDKNWDYMDRYQIGKETSVQYNHVVALNQSTLNLHLKREPRFYANIAADRCYWQRGPVAGDNLLVQPYKGERFGVKQSIITPSSPQNPTGYWLKKMTISRIETRSYHLEIMSNKAFPFVAMRMSELYLMLAEAWNEYEGPSQKVYDALNVVRERAGIPDVVSSWRNYSKDPSRVDSKEGMRSIIRQETNIELAFEGHRFWNLRRWNTAHLELNQKQYGWNILGENARTFYNNFEGPIMLNDKPKFMAPRDYFFPIRSEEILLTGCVQNVNW